MRRIDWTDYRQALAKHYGSDEMAVKNLSRSYPLDDIFEAQKAYREKVENANIKEALNRQNCFLTNGSRADLDLLRKNGKSIGDLIRAGINR